MGSPLSHEENDETFNQAQCYNPAKNFQLDWYDDAKITEDPRTAAYSNTLTLVGVGEYGIRGGNPVIVKLETGFSNDYFVGFNRAAGANRFNDQGDDQVNIVQVENGDGAGFSQSWLRALLSQGDSYAISDFGGTGKTVTITVNSIDITTSPGTAVVYITDGQDPPPPSPPPTPLPPCPSGQNRYQVTVTTDNWPGETSWTLTNTCTGTQVLAGSGYTVAGTSYPSEEKCADAGKMEFVINVSYFLFLRVFICPSQNNQLLTL